MNSLSRVRLLVTPWSAAYQAPPSMGFSRQEYWSGVPLPSPITFIGQCFWVFVSVWSIILFLSSQVTGLRTLPRMCGQLLTKMDPTPEACGCMSTLIMGWAPSLFGHQGGFLPLYREVFFDLRSGPLISLLPQTSPSATRFALGVCE